MAEPWRAPRELEIAMEKLVLVCLQTVIEQQEPEMLQYVLRSARSMGYVPPPDDDDEDLESFTATAKWRCCPGFGGSYQRLGGSNGVVASTVAGGSAAAYVARGFVRNERWCTEVHGLLRNALSGAVSGARAAPGDVNTVRWLGALLAVLEPDAVQQLSCQLAYAVGALQRAAGLGGYAAGDSGASGAAGCQGADGCETDGLRRMWACGELQQLVAAAAGSQSSVPGASGLTAFGWALRLPLRQAKATLSALAANHLSAAGKTTPTTPNEVAAILSERISERGLIVAEGNASAALLAGFRAVVMQPATVSASTWAPQGCGHWFFEVRILGHAPGVGTAVSDTGDAVGGVMTGSLACRVGWLYGADRGLSTSTSRSIAELVVQGSPQVPHHAGPLGIPGQGIVGCCLSISGEPGAHSFQAAFALDGAWLPCDADRQAVDLVHLSSWQSCEGGDARLAGGCSHGGTEDACEEDDVPVPAVSGRIACEFLLEPSSFVFGPPSAKYRPLREGSQSSPGMSSGCGDLAKPFGTAIHGGTEPIPPPQLFGKGS